MKWFTSMTFVGKLIVIVFFGALLYGCFNFTPVGPAASGLVPVAQTKVAEFMATSTPGPTKVPTATVAPVVPTKVGQVAPTVATTVPGQPTVVQPTVTPLSPQAKATAAACAGLPEVDIALVPFGPYYLWVYPSIVGTDCKNGVKFNFVLLDKEEEIVQWVLGTPADRYFPALSAEKQKDKRYVVQPGHTRLVLTTQNSCVFYANCRVIDLLGRSDGNDAVLSLVKSIPPINTWDDIVKRKYLGGAIGNVNEFMPKAMGWACGYSFTGEFQPRLTSEQAALDFIGGQADVLSDYEPYVSDVLVKMGPNVRVNVSSKSFIGILDVVLASSSANPEITSKALLAFNESLPQLMEAGKEDFWDKLYNWSAGNDERLAIIGPYTNADEVWSDIGREALFTPAQKVRAFGSDKSILVERMFQTLRTFALSPTFHSGGSGVPFYPANGKDNYVDPSTFVDTRPMDLIKNDPRMKVSAKVPNNNIQLVSFAPSSTGTTLLSNLPLLDVQFRGGSADFVDPGKAQDELIARVYQCLKLFEVNLRLQIATDDLAQQRADRVKILLTRAPFNVPEAKIVFVRQAGLPAGTVQIAIVGTAK